MSAEGLAVDDVLLWALASGDVLLLQDVLQATDENQRQRALDAALVWGDVECVRILSAATADISGALARMRARDLGQLETAQTLPEAVAVLHSELLKRQVPEGTLGAAKRDRL